jgi:toxin CcdB
MRFDIYRPPAGGAAYLVDVQSDFLEHLPTRIVIPLRSVDQYRSPIKDVHPAFDIEGGHFLLMTHELASIQKRLLQQPVASLAEHRDEITRALDILLTGF